MPRTTKIPEDTVVSSPDDKENQFSDDESEAKQALLVVPKAEGPRRSGRTRRTIVPKGTFGDDTTSEEEDGDDFSVQEPVAKKRKSKAKKKGAATASKNAKSKKGASKTSKYSPKKKPKTMSSGAPKAGSFQAVLMKNASPSIQHITENAWQSGGDWRSSGAIDY